MVGYIGEGEVEPSLALPLQGGQKSTPVQESHSVEEVPPSYIVLVELLPG